MFALFPDEDFSFALALRLVKEALEGLQYLHSLGIAHLNLRPQNIFLNSAKTVKLADIGHRHTPDCSWSAPEMIKQQARTKVCDIFAMGCIACYILTNGSHPFGEVVRLHRQRIVKGQYDLSLIERQDTQYLVEQMLCPNPMKRYTVEKCRNFISFWEEQKVLTFLMVVSSANLSLYSSSSA